MLSSPTTSLHLPFFLLFIIPLILATPTSPHHPLQKRSQPVCELVPTTFPFVISDCIYAISAISDFAIGVGLDYRSTYGRITARGAVPDYPILSLTLPYRTCIFSLTAEPTGLQQASWREIQSAATEVLTWCVRLMRPGYKWLDRQHGDINSSRPPILRVSLTPVGMMLARPPECAVRQEHSRTQPVVAAGAGRECARRRVDRFWIPRRGGGTEGPVRPGRGLLGEDGVNATVVVVGEWNVTQAFGLGGGSGRGNGSVGVGVGG
ncbi:hypothetical protein MMC21_006596 [Puttea exsequens]|nr:hypothetical protein [Puttea exsequens]